MSINEIGAICFGAVVGWICYRTLRHKNAAALSDIATVIGVVGGGAVSTRFSGTTFGWYSVGLAAGFFLYFVIALFIAPAKDRAGVWMGD